MKIESVKSEKDAIEFAQEEFQRSGIGWDVYTLVNVVEITEQKIKELKLKYSSPGWSLTFKLNNSPGFETKYLFLDISPLHGTIDIVTHY